MNTCHPTTPTLSLFTAMNNDTILRAALSAERAPLGLMRPPESAGAYILFAGAPTTALRRHGPEITSGTFPIYVGSARLLPSRLNRHRQTIASATGLKVQDFWIATIPTDTLASALGIEQELITEIRPPWNERSMSGFGSAPQGENRKVRTARANAQAASIACSGASGRTSRPLRKFARFVAL
jgi:hypothetical protein